MIQIEQQTNVQEQIAFELKAEYGAQYEYAWVSHQGKVYFAKYPKGLEGPCSAVVKLIQHLFDDYVDQSFFILRNRIFCTGQLTLMCEGMVQLAAKRASGGILPNDWGQPSNLPKVKVGDPEQHVLQTKHAFEVTWKPPYLVSDAIEAHYYLHQLISRIPRGDVLHDFNRPIAAFICSPEGRLLSWAVNNSSKNKTLHAEVAAIQKFHQNFKTKLPAGAVIYTSLKPCRMCAGMIVDMAENPKDLRVIYFQDDPGPLAQNTELEKRKLLKHYLLQDVGKGS